MCIAVRPRGRAGGTDPVQARAAPAASRTAASPSLAPLGSQRPPPAEFCVAGEFSVVTSLVAGSLVVKSLVAGSLVFKSFVAGSLVVKSIVAGPLVVKSIVAGFRRVAQGRDTAAAAVARSRAAPTTWSRRRPQRQQLTGRGGAGFFWI